MSPVIGRAGDTVTIICSHINMATKVAFDGIEATIAFEDSSSRTHELKLAVFVPKTAKTGHVYVSDENKQGVDAGLFTILSSVAPVDSALDNLAQGRSGSSAGSAWPGAPLPTSPAVQAPAFDRDLDLPFVPPVYAPVTSKATTAPKPPVLPKPAAPVSDPIPPPTIYGHTIVSPNHTVVYVIDCSGSMTLDIGQYTTPDGKTAQGDRLDRAKAALTSSIQSLAADWQFNIISYQCGVTMWRTALIQALPSAKQAAVSWLMQDVYAGGATGTGPAVTVVFNTWSEARLVVLLTDGAPNCGAGDDSGDPSCIAAHRVMISGNNRTHATINVFGIGATGDFKQFCEDVAGDAGGSYTDVR
jgi:hypothetical protein